MENITALLANRFLDPNDSAASIAEDALDMMEKLDSASKHQFLSILLLQTLSIGMLNPNSADKENCIP
jgi:hypothetical protein